MEAAPKLCMQRNFSSILLPRVRVAWLTRFCVAALMQLLKPLEFYLFGRQLSRPQLSQACTRDLCIAVGMGAPAARPVNTHSLVDEPGSPTKAMPSHRSGVSGRADMSTDLDSIGSSMVITREGFAEKLAEKVSYLRQHKRGKLLAKLFWMVALARVSILQQQLEMETSMLSRHFSEICECLEGIQRWLCNGSQIGRGEPHRWKQKTIRNQGALIVLTNMLDFLSNCGFPTNGGWTPGSRKTQLGNANMRAVRASLMFLRISNGLYDILRLACTGFPKTALIFRKYMALFDLHLGSELRAAPLMRQMFTNPTILMTLSREDMLRYTLLMAAHKKPAFVGLLSSIVLIGSQPVPQNQQLITHLLLGENKWALPSVRVEQDLAALPGEGAVPGQGISRLFIKLHAGSEIRNEEDDEWIDLCAYRGRVLDMTNKDVSGDARSMALLYYAECLSLFYDLCKGRNTDAVVKLASNSQLCLSYPNVLAAMKSKLVPKEIRFRLARLMIVMYLDREPQQARLPIEFEYVWSKVQEKPLTSRPVPDPFAEMPALSVTTNFADLKAHVLDFMKLAVFEEAPEEGIASALRLLIVHCQIALKLCAYGFFTPGIHNPAGIHELQDLLGLVHENLVTGKLLKDGLKMAKSNARELQLKLVELLAFGIAKRTDLRKQFVLAAYDKCFQDFTADDSRFWDQTLLRKIADTMKEDPLLGSIKNGLTQPLLSLAGADDCLPLQREALKLLRLDVTQDDELQRVLSRTHLLASDYAVRCFNTVCVCDGHIRSGKQNLTELGEATTEVNIAAKGRTMVLKSLQTISDMLDPGQHVHSGEDSMQVVADLRQLLRSREVCDHVMDILRIPFEREQTQGGMDELKDPNLTQIIKACYVFIVQFCRGSPENQERAYVGIMEPLIEHLNIKHVNASEALSAAVENNAALLDKLPERLLRRFFAGIGRCGKIARFLRFLKVTTSVHEIPHRRTQDLVLRLLQDEKELILELDGNKGASESDDEVSFVLVLHQQGSPGDTYSFVSRAREEEDRDYYF